MDPVDSVEIPVASSLAERVLGLVSVLYPQIVDKKIVERMIENTSQKESEKDPHMITMEDAQRDRHGHRNSEDYGKEKPKQHN